jgi:hypothetical protein
MKCCFWRMLGMRIAFLVVWFLPAINVPAQRLRFGAVGDSGSGGDEQYRLAGQMDQWTASNPWEFLLLLGDNVYPNGKPALFDAHCFKPFSGLRAKGVKIHATLGNHDVRHYAARKGCAQVRDPRFGFAGENDEYTVEAGGEAAGKKLVRIIVLNSMVWEKITRGGNARMPDCRNVQVDRVSRLKRWLSESGRFHWNILVMHHPLYSFVKPWYRNPFLRGHGSSIELRRMLEPLIAGKVDIVLSGHDHFYERIAPQKGIYYFVSGGGSNLRPGGDFQHPLVQKGGKINHFLDLDVTPGEVQFRVVDEGGRIFDQQTLTRLRK